MMVASLVTVGIPTRDRPADLANTLREIRGWDYANLDILVSDNAPTDESRRVVAEAQAADPRVRYEPHVRSLGLYGNHNFCIEQCRGEFLAFVHDHDAHDPGMISAFVRFLQDHPRVGVVSSDWEIIGADGRVLGFRDHAVAPVTSGLAFIERTMRSGRTSVGIPGALIRREALGGIRFEEGGPIGFEDFVVWCSIAERWDVGHISRRLWGWRQAPTSQSARKIVSLTEDCCRNLSKFCDGYAVRHPGEAGRANRWRRSVRRFLFWALAYEIGLATRPAEARTEEPTLFEILGYRLSKAEFQTALEQMRGYRTGAVQHAAGFGIETLVRLRLTQPLAWATRHHAALRGVLGLR